MTNRQHSDYKGCSITTRWAEVPPPATDWMDINAVLVSQDRQFKASFLAQPRNAEAPWQEFPEAVFNTSAHAVANARTVAERSVDVRLEELRDLGIETGFGVIDAT